MKNNNLFFQQSGTLLLETCLAASIFLTLFPLLILKGIPMYEEEQTTQFLGNLTTFLETSQMTAYTERRKVTIEFNLSSHKVLSYYSLLDQIDSLTIPSFITVEKGSLPLILYFSSQGTVSQAGTLFLHSTTKIYQLTFLLGQGRFYVKES